MFKHILAIVLGALGITAFQKKDGKESMTEEQKTKLVSLYGDKFVQEFESQLTKYGSAGPEEATATITAELETARTDLQAAQGRLTQLEGDVNASKAEKQALDLQITNLTETITKLSASAETDPPAKTVAKVIGNLDPGNSKFLFGIESPIMAIDDKRSYNRRAYEAICKANRIPYQADPHASDSFDYSALTADLGDFYRTQKQKEIRSFLRSLPSLETLFPLESGYQDQDVLINLFMNEEFSQAENTIDSNFDSMVKGSYNFEPEILKMYGVMFVHKFSNLKKLEKQWIGYLNKEGSSTMKWSFIQYILVETTKKLHNERELRRINGVYKAPTPNTPGAALAAADGLREYVRKKIANFQIRPFVLGEPTPSNMATYLYNYCSLIPEDLRDSGTMELEFSSTLVTWYHKNRETLYGLNQDYKADIMYVAEYPNIAIKPIPNMGASKRIICTFSGNIKNFEDQPGEMANFQIEQQDWTLKVWSNWKEAIQAFMVGKKYNSLAEMPTDYSTQLIFCNDWDLPSNYYINMTANDTSPSVLQHTAIQSVANTQATAITDIDDAVVGVPIRIKCNNATHAITIAKADKFSLLTAAWNPDLGDVLVVMKRTDGKFVELQRLNSTSDALTIAADDASPDVQHGNTFVTSANTVASPLVPVALTTLDNASYNVIYTIYGGSNTNSTTIANAGNFVLTAAMTLSNGAWIKLIKSEVDNKFYELSRG